MKAILTVSFAEDGRANAPTPRAAIAIQRALLDCIDILSLPTGAPRADFRGREPGRHIAKGAARVSIHGWPPENREADCSTPMQRAEQLEVPYLAWAAIMA